MGYNFWESQVKGDERAIAKCKEDLARARYRGDKDAARVYESSLASLESIRSQDMINFQKSLVNALKGK